MTVGSSSKQATGTQSVERAIGLLREIATFGKDGARAADLIQRCNMEYPTVHRILKALVEQDVVIKNPITRRYSLGDLIYELSLGLEPRLNVRAYFESMTTALAEATGDTIFLNVRSHHDVVCVDRKLGSFPIKTLVFDVGSRRPLGVGAAGIALLMSYPMTHVQEIVRINCARFARYGKTNAEQVLTMVRRAKEVGYVATYDGVVPGVRAVSLPFGGDGRMPSCAVSVAAVPSRLPSTRVAELVAIMQTLIDKLGSKDARARVSGHSPARPSLSETIS